MTVYCTIDVTPLPGLERSARAHFYARLSLRTRSTSTSQSNKVRKADKKSRTVVGSVCVCVCLSVTQHLASRMFIRPTNDMTYLTGDEGQNICGVFSENAPLQS